MSEHTKESLDALPNKGEVVAIAESLGLETEGTRREVRDRILNFSPVVAESADSEEVVSEPVVDDSPATETTNSSEVDPQRARDDAGHFAPNDPDTAVNEAYDPPKKGAFTDRAFKVAEQRVASYIGAEAAAAASDELRDALAAGKQPCIVKGDGNARFALEICDDTLHRQDVSKDAPAIANIARFLADRNLYPGG